MRSREGGPRPASNFARDRVTLGRNVPGVNDLAAARALEAMPHPPLGPVLRAARRSRGMSLAQVAAATGISRSLLSLIETGRSDVTVGRLSRLATLYGLSVGELLAESDQGEAVVVRRKERQRLHSGAEGVDIYGLAPSHRQMFAFVAVWEPGGALDEFASHEGEEVALVIEGRMRVEFEGADAIELERGDTVYYDSSRPHRWSNAGDVLARVVAVTTPPNF
jgi:transcriptional regulator with XRE-family HTH domain